MNEQGINTLTKTDTGGREEMRSASNFISPAVDIFETDETLTFVVDLPGVEEDELDINFEKGFLTFSAKINLKSKGSLISHEFTASNYYRQFKLPETLDIEKTSAELVDGVLTLTISKVEAAKPHRIEVKH